MWVVPHFRAPNIQPLGGPWGLGGRRPLRIWEFGVRTVRPTVRRGERDLVSEPPAGQDGCDGGSVVFRTQAREGLLRIGTHLERYRIAETLAG